MIRHKMYGSVKPTYFPQTKKQGEDPLRAANRKVAAVCVSALWAFEKIVACVRFCGADQLSLSSPSSHTS